MEISNCSGEDLLELFDTLNIELGNLNPNVIKAWFDTDCTDTKDFLRWMCMSISHANLLSAQERVEVSELDATLLSDNYERNLSLTEENFPGIFDDPDSVKFDIELLEDEKQLYSEELEQLENILSIHEKVHERSCSDLHKITKEEISAKLKLEKTEEQCETLAKKLDNINIKLLEQIQRYGGYLYDFEFSAVPHFIHNMGFDACEDNYHIMSGYLNTFLKREYQELSENITVNKSIFSENSSVELINERICAIKNRIFHSWRKYLREKFKEGELKAVLYFLNNNNNSYSSFLIDRVQIEMNIESKMEQTCVMLEMIENICAKHAEYLVSQPNLHYAQRELATQELKSTKLEEISRDISKLLATYLIMNTLFVQENNDIINSNGFFKGIVGYVTKDLQKCIMKTESMSQVIEEFKNYNSTSIVQKYKIIEEIAKHTAGQKDEEMTIMKAVSLRNELRDEVHFTLQQMCDKDFETYRENFKVIKCNIKTLNNFLMCGPTSRVVAIPLELFSIFKEICAYVENQNTAVKSTVDVITNTSNILNKKKWLKNRRLLWMHFLNDHPKLLALMKSVEHEYNSLKIAT